MAERTITVVVGETATTGNEFIRLAAVINAAVWQVMGAHYERTGKIARDIWVRVEDEETAERINVRLADSEVWGGDHGLVP